MSGAGSLVKRWHQGNVVLTVTKFLKGDMTFRERQARPAAITPGCGWQEPRSGVAQAPKTSPRPPLGTWEKTRLPYAGLDRAPRFSGAWG